MHEVFFSHNNEDWDFVNRIFEMLDRISISCYVYEHFPEYGEYLPEIIKRNIKDSKILIVLLTQNSVRSQWVNQEIGIAFALKKLIIPIVESGVETKGFVELRQHIDYDKNVPEEAIYSLIYRLRELYAKDNIKLNCENEKCENYMRKFSEHLPTQQEINNAIERDLRFKVQCPSCGSENYFNPKTLEQENLSGTMFNNINANGMPRI